MFIAERAGSFPALLNFVYILLDKINSVYAFVQATQKEKIYRPKFLLLKIKQILAKKYKFDYNV